MAAESERKKRQYLRSVALGLCPRCNQRKPAKSKKTCRTCSNDRLERYYENKEHQLLQQRAYRQRLRDETYAVYGTHCSCCGEARVEFLQIDHVHGTGAIHRRTIGRASHSLFIWLRRNNYPAGFRILCANCNFSRGTKGYCPHEKEQEDERNRKVRR